MTEKLSDWRHAFGFRSQRPVNPEQCRRYYILYSSRPLGDTEGSNPVFVLTDADGKGDEVAVDEAMCVVEPPGAHAFLRTIGAGQASKDAIDWLRCEAQVFREDDTYRAVTLQVWINGVPFEDGVVSGDTHSTPYCLPGVYRFIRAAQDAAGALEHTSGRHNPLVHLPRALRDTRLILEDKLHGRVKASPEICVLALPGLRLPLNPAKDDQVIYIDTVNGSWEARALEQVAVSWKVCGALARVPALYYAFYHTATLVAKEAVAKETVAKGRPSLVISSHVAKWREEGASDPSLVVIESFDDLERFRFHDTGSTARVVVVDTHFYRSSAYDAYLLNLTGVLLEASTSLPVLHSTKPLHTYLADYVKRHPLLLDRASFSAVHLATARSILGSILGTPGSALTGIPLELREWNLVVWEDVRAVPAHYYRRLAGVEASFHMGFTAFEPALESEEIQFMRHLCIEPSRRGPGCVAHTLVPNTGDLVHACYLPMDLSWSPAQVSNVKRHRVTLNPFERYAIGVLGTSVDLLTPNEIQCVLLPATQTMQCNKESQFVLCCPEDVEGKIGDHFAQEIQSVQAQLDEKHRCYTAELATLERLESLPPSTHQPSRRQPRTPPPPPPVRPLNAPLLGSSLLGSSTLSLRDMASIDVPRGPAIHPRDMASIDGPRGPPSPGESLRVLGRRLMGRQPPTTTLTVSSAAQVPDLRLPFDASDDDTGRLPTTTTITALLEQAIAQQLATMGASTIEMSGMPLTISGSIALPLTNGLTDISGGTPQDGDGTTRGVELEQAPTVQAARREPAVQPTGDTAQDEPGNGEPQQRRRPVRASTQYDVSGVLTRQMENSLKHLLEDMGSLSKYIKDLTLQKARSVSMVKGKEGVAELLKETCSVCMSESCEVIIPCLHPLCLSCAWRLFTHKGIGHRDRRVHHAECPCCKTVLALRDVLCPLLNTHAPPSLHTMVDSRTAAIVEAVEKWVSSMASAMAPSTVISHAAVITASEEESQAVLLGAYYSGLDHPASFRAHRWSFGDPLVSSSLEGLSAIVYVMHRDDFEDFPVHVPVQIVFSTFDVGDDLAELPLYRYFLPSEFKLPPVECFSYR